MESMIHKDLQEEMQAARRAKQRKASPLRIEVDGRRYPILKMWKTGFAMSAEDAPSLRGFVDIHERATHLFQCLIVTSAEEDGEIHYEFKRVTPAAQSVPLDFERAEDAPVGLLTDES